MCDQTRGDWTEPCFALSAEAKRVFETATAGFQSVKYTPCAFASQVLAGTRYSFLCGAESLADREATYVVKMRIFQPLCGQDAPIQVKPIIVSIETISP